MRDDNPEEHQDQNFWKPFTLSMLRNRSWPLQSSVFNNQQLYKKYHKNGNYILSIDTAWKLCHEVNKGNDLSDMLDLHAQTLDNALEIVDD